jgi:hypothetical protein
MATIPKEILKDSVAMDRYLETLKDPLVMERFLKAQSDGIGAGYAAIYREPGAEEIGVYALQFSTAISDSQRERLLKHDVVILGSMAVRLWVDGDSRKCFEVVKRHVLAVKARSGSLRGQP